MKKTYLRPEVECIKIGVPTYLVSVETGQVLFAVSGRRGRRSGECRGLAVSEQPKAKLRPSLTLPPRGGFFCFLYYRLGNKNENNLDFHFVFRSLIRTFASAYLIRKVLRVVEEARLES